MIKDILPKLKTKNITVDLEPKTERTIITINFKAIFTDIENIPVWLRDNFYKNSFTLNVERALSENELDNIIDEPNTDRSLTFNISDLNTNKIESDSVEFSVTVDAPGLEIDYLSLVYYFTINGNFLADKYNISSDQEFFDDTFSISVEKILENGEIVSDAFAFFDEDGELWTGEIEKRDASFFKEGTDELLQERVVDNTKIQDLRNFRDENFSAKIKDASSAKKFRFEQEFTTLFEQEVKQKSSARLELKPAREYFTKPFISRKFSTGNPSIIFGVNWRELVEDASEFRGLAVGNKDRYQAIESLTDIFNLRVVRKRVERVDTFNKLETKIEDIREVEDDIKLRSVIDSGADLETGFESQDDILSELPLKNITEDIRFFTFEDKEAGNLTDGEYSYEIELVISEGSREFLEQVLDRFRQLKTLIEDYRGQSNIFLRGSGNSSKFAFTSRFQSRMDLIFGNSPENAPWNIIKNTMVETLNLVFDQKDLRFFSKLATGNLLSPEAGSPESLRKIDSLINSLQTSVKNILGEERVGINDSESSNNSKKSRVVKEPKRLKLDYLLGKTFDADTKLNIDFFRHLDQSRKEIFDTNNNFPSFGNIDNKSSGLTEVNIDFLNSRKASEIDKFFNDRTTDVSFEEEPEIIVENLPDFSFTPTYMNIKNSKVDLSLPKKLDIDSLKIVENFSFFDTSNVPDENEISKGLGILPTNFDFDVSNLLLSDIFADNFENGFLDKPKKDCTINPKDLVPDDVSSAIIEQTKLISGNSSDTIPRIKKLSEFNSYNPASNNEFFEGKIDDLPMQIRSLATLHTNQSAIVNNEVVESFKNEQQLNYQKIPYFRNIYSMIFSIEVFNGFEKETERSFIKSPKWRILTEDDLEGGGYLLCRFNKNQNNPLKFLSDDLYKDATVYDEYFLINLGEELPEDEQEEIEEFPVEEQIPNFAKRTFI